MSGPDARPWAVVLGVSCGTGAAIARALARSPGWNIFGVHRGNHPEDAEALARDVAALGVRLHLRTGDAGTWEGAQEGAAELREVAGPRAVKMMVHSVANASVGRLAGGGGPMLAPRQIQKTFDSMAHSFVYWTQQLLERDLLAPRAHILGLSNWMEDSVMRGAPLIAATKAALGAYTRHLAHDLGPLGHRVNLLKFGGVITPAVEQTFGAEHLARLSAVLTRVSAHRRISTVEEVGRMVSLLAGDDMARFNGATIDFTGGESMALFDALMHFDEGSTS